MAGKIRVGVCGHDLKFWNPLQAVLEQTGRYEFRHDLWKGHESHDPAVSDGLIEWADVLVAEWALGNAVYYSKRARAGQRLFVRLHAQERRTEYPNLIHYENVDQVVFVGRHVMDECLAKFRIPPEKCVVAGNMVDVQRFNHAKFGGSEFVLGLIGTAPSSKRLDLALDTLELLLEKDDRYQLRIKGPSPATIDWLWRRAPEREYYEAAYTRINSGNLRYKVNFDPKGDDVHHWLKMVGTLLSPSDHESFHMAVAEGAASGALPVVWGWKGASSIYPEFQLVDTPEDAAKTIDFYNRNAAGARMREQGPGIIDRMYGTAAISGFWDGILSGTGTRQASAVKRVGRRRVVAVWAIDGWATFHRREMLEALASHLRETHHFIIIEPGNHYQTIERLGWAPASELEEIAGGRVIEVASNIFRTRLFTGGIPDRVSVAPFQGRSDPLDILMGLLKHRYGPLADVLHWVYKPDQALRLKDRDFVYEVYDDYTMDFASGELHEGVAAEEVEALAKARHVFFTSKPLLDRKSRYARSASMVGNGAPTDLFSRYRVSSGPRVGRPVAGYLGNLSTFFDWELMADVCSRLEDVDFIFHGQIELGDADPRRDWLRQLSAMENVMFTGRVGRYGAAAAVNRCDVLLIPFVTNEAMHAVNPLKLWEYLATGRPVVTTPMDAVEIGFPLIFVASGLEQWVESIKASLSENANDVQLEEERIEMARNFSWTNLTTRHAAVLESI